MNEIEKGVQELAEMELASANEKFPPFHSAHEGWAVLLEEIKELKAEVKAAQHFHKALFYSVMMDELPREMMMNTAQEVREKAIMAACEAIQVAAMAQKFMDMGNILLTPEEISKMHFDKVWLDYGVDESGIRMVEDGVVFYGKLYSIDTLEGADFEGLLLDACAGEILDYPTGKYRVYRSRPTEEG